MSVLRYNPVIYTASFIGWTSATLNVTEADDTVTATATLKITAALNSTEADDTVTATATLKITGLLNITEADDTVIVTDIKIDTPTETALIIMSKPRRTINYRMRSRVAEISARRLINV